jgi:hypothetical protein
LQGRVSGSVARRARSLGVELPRVRRRG